MRKLPPQYLIAALIIAAVAAAVGLYHRYGSNTRVAFVNYPEYLLAPLMNQELNPAIEATPLRWTETSGEELKNYDMIIFFGMGLNFTEKQQQLLATLKKPLYVTASTRTETALNTLTGRQREEIAAYLGNGGKENFRRMLDYIRYEVDGKRLRAARPQPPKKSNAIRSSISARTTPSRPIRSIWPGTKRPAATRRMPRPSACSPATAAARWKS